MSHNKIVKLDLLLEKTLPCPFIQQISDIELGLRALEPTDTLLLVREWVV